MYTYIYIYNISYICIYTYIYRERERDRYASWSCHVYKACVYTHRVLIHVLRTMRCRVECSVTSACNNTGMCYLQMCKP